jgi:hypothetical protein
MIDQQADVQRVIGLFLAAAAAKEYSYECGRFKVYEGPGVSVTVEI